MTAQFAAVSQLDKTVLALDPRAGYFLGREYFHAKAPGLGYGTPRQIATAQAYGEAQIIFDARTGARLPAWSFAFDQHRAQPFGCSVDGGGQTRRAGADNDQIVKRHVGMGAQAKLLSKLWDRGLAQRGPVSKDDERQR